MKINGKSVALDVSQNLTSWLQKQGYSLQRVAVVLNGEIIPKEKFDYVMLSDSDKVDVISFVEGG